MQKFFYFFALLFLSTNMFAQDHTVTLQGLEFIPRDIVIRAGETVEWDNVMGTHNVNGSMTTYPDNPEGFFSGSAADAPWTFSHTFTQTGFYNYQCDPHVDFDMFGTVTVLPQICTIASVTANNADGEPDSLGVTCELQGIVYGVNLRPSGLQFTLIDENNDGIGVFSFDNFGYTVQEGDEIAIQGEITFFNGLTQVEPDTVILLSSDNELVDPTIVTALGEDTESQLVTIENVTLVDPGAWETSGSFNADVTNGMDTFTVRIDSDVEISGMDAPTGTFNITGLGGQFDSSAPHDEGYQLFPRYASDIDPYVTANPDYPAYSIGLVTTNNASEVPDSLGVLCELQGVVYGVNFRPAGLQFTIIDENNDGIGTFSLNENFGYTVQEGDDVTIRGEVSFFNGLTQMNLDTVILNSSGNALFDPTVVTVLGEDTESQLVTIENVTLVDPGAWETSGSFNVDVTNGSETFTVRIDSDVDISGMNAPMGTFDVTGIGGQFDSSDPHDEGYQLFPRYAADIDPYIVEETDYPLYPIGLVTSNNADGEPDSLDVQCEIQGVVYGVNIRPAGLQFTLIDENNDGIGVFSLSDNFGYTVQEGDAIAIQGTIGFFNGLTQIEPDTVIFDSADNALFDPTVVTALGEDTESQLVTVENVSLVDPGQWQTSGSFNAEVTDGTNTYQIRIDSDVDIAGMPAPIGTFNVTGLGGQFDGSAPYDEGYQLLPRYVADIDPYEVEEVLYPPYTIAEVTTLDDIGQPDSLDVACELTGFTYGINFRPGGLTFTLIDDNNDGIGIFNTNNDFGYDVTEGDEITVQGTIAFFNGLTQMVVDTVIVVSTGNALIDPTVVTALSEDTESQLVTIENVSLVDPGQWQTSGSFNVDLTDGTNNYQIRIDSDTDISGMNAPEGVFNVTGLGGQFDNSEPYDEGYQLFPRYVQDIDPYNTSETQFPDYTIAEVTGNDADGNPDSLGVNCTLTGVVYGINYRPGGLQFTLIDENNDGIHVFSNSDDLGYTVVEGEEVAVQGSIGFFNGLTELIPVEVTVLSTGNTLFDPTVVTALGEDTESQLVRINGLTLVDPLQWQTSGSFNVDLTDGTNTYQMRIDNDTDIIGTGAPDFTFDLIGLGGQFDSDAPYDEGYQIFPRYLTDIIMVTGVGEEHLGIELDIYPNPTSDLLRISSEVQLDQVQLFNTFGQEVTNLVPNATTIDLDMKALPQGVYVLRVVLEGRSWATQIVKQ